MRRIIPLNFGWEFTPCFSEAFVSGKACEGTETVDLPHTCMETPYNYFDEHLYQMVCGYRRTLRLPQNAAGKRVFLIVGAAGQNAQVYLDGSPVGQRHRCGYTSFTVELTMHMAPDRDALLTIEVDSRESLNQPPFGNVIDYMTFGGLYREVWLEIREPSYIADVFPQPAASGKLISRIDVEGNACSIRQTVLFDGAVIVSRTFAVDEEYSLFVPDVQLWDIDNPVLYTLVTELLDEDGSICDRAEQRIGFRDAVFRKDGFWLNGRKVKLLGLNRHQSYPFIGYAAPAALQRYDADILKRELGLNAMRTSHYPQSQHFIDRCNELGLLVFTEIPGWQHIGDDQWKDIAVQNVRDMVTQYRCHPSVILWGVRINESKDDDALYTRTNALAHELDPTRQTGGVRCYKKGSLLEDVYTYNDFFHDGTNGGCEPKKNVTSDMKKCYLISEFNGHMCPTKPFDDEEHRQEHALRHARVLDSVWDKKDIAGCFGWCFFDYNTHRDFGSGDRICYHGVTDMFRNPKLAAAVYASMQDDIPVLEISSDMNIGERPAGNRGRVYLFTNADSVRFYKNDIFIKEYTHNDSAFRHFPCPPIEMDDFIGDQIEQNESFSKKQAGYIRDILNESTRFGISHISASAKRKAAVLILRYHMSFRDAYALYGKYIGNWGDKSTVYRFEAVKGGKVVKTVCKTPFTELRLRALASHTELVEDTTYDMALVRLQMTDQNGNMLPFYTGAAEVSLTGPAQIIGAQPVILRGGCGGLYIKSTGTDGPATLTIRADGAEEVVLRFNVTARSHSEEGGSQ